MLLIDEHRETNAVYFAEWTQILVKVLKSATLSFGTPSSTSFELSVSLLRQLFVRFSMQVWDHGSDGDRSRGIPRWIRDGLA